MCTSTGQGPGLGPAPGQCHPSPIPVPRPFPVPCHQEVMTGTGKNGALAVSTPSDPPSLGNKPKKQLTRTPFRERKDSQSIESEQNPTVHKRYRQVCILILNFVINC